MIVITGASGFIGRYLTARLLKNRYALILCSRRQSIRRLFPQAKNILLDLAQENQLKKLPSQDVEAVVHLASFVPPSVNRDTIDTARKSLKVNIQGTLNVLEYVRRYRINKLIFASTISVYGDTLFPPDEGDPAYPTSFYGLSKLAAEMLCEKYRRDYGIDCFSLRLGSVYGAEQVPNIVIPKFIRTVLLGQPIVIWGEGKKRVDFIYVKDVVSAILCALKSKSPGVYNIGSGKPASILELAQQVKTVFAKNGPTRSCAQDRGRAIVFDKDKPEDTVPVWFDISKAKKELGFYPKYSLRDGLKDYKRELMVKEK